MKHRFAEGLKEIFYYYFRIAAQAMAASSISAYWKAQLAARKLRAKRAAARAGSTCSASVGGSLYPYW